MPQRIPTGRMTTVRMRAVGIAALAAIAAIAALAALAAIAAFAALAAIAAIAAIAATEFAAKQIYKASSPIKVSPTRFFEPNDVAMADIERCAELEKQGKIE